MKTKGELTKEKILQVAMNLFGKKAFTSVSIRQIAKVAEISPALIYKYYADQEELYFEVMKLASHELLEELKDCKTLEKLVETYIHFMITTETLFQLMTHFMIDSERPGSHFPIIKEIDKVLTLLEEKIPLTNAKMESQLLFSTLNGLLITYRNLPNRNKDEALIHIQKLANYYIINLKERSLKR
ncbi:TetR/AcrR family transcriptional regulator [Solibacillus sp. FSL K6-1523]|uniref:TetR/AcrR family transcriptional regulator n=1 Tax=Solibacillus sp. FSL K6-1523 TaxID=2921471 RepID=UPI0030FB1FA2